MQQQGVRQHTGKHTVMPPLSPPCVFHFSALAHSHLALVSWSVHISQFNSTSLDLLIMSLYSHLHSPLIVVVFYLPFCSPLHVSFCCLISFIDDISTLLWSLIFLLPPSLLPGSQLCFLISCLDHWHPACSIRILVSMVAHPLLFDCCSMQLPYIVILSHG